MKLPFLVMTELLFRGSEEFPPFPADTPVDTIRLADPSATHHIPDPFPGAFSEPSDALPDSDPAPVEGSPEKSGHVLFLSDAGDGSCQMLLSDPAGEVIWRYQWNTPHTLFEIFNHCMDILDHFRKLFAALEESRIQGGFREEARENDSLERYISRCSRIVGSPAYLVDSTYQVLAIDPSPIYSEISAIWRHLTGQRYLSYDIISALQDSGELQQMDTRNGSSLVRSEIFPTEFINCTLENGGRIIGHLFFVGYNQKLTPGKVALAEQIRQHTQKILAEEATFFSSRYRGYENFLIHVLENHLPEETMLKRQLAALHWEQDGLYCLAAIQPESADSLTQESICRELESQSEGKPVILGSRVICIFLLTDHAKRQALTKYLHSLANTWHYPVAMSDCFSGFIHLPLYYRQTLQILQQKYCTREQPFCQYSDIAVRQMMQSILPEEDRSLLLDPAIEILHQYDLQNGSDYRNTLKVYLQNERNITETSRRLYIHRNTLLYRIERLKELTGLDLDNPAIRLRLLLSLL